MMKELEEMTGMDFAGGLMGALKTSRENGGRAPEAEKLIESSLRITPYERRRETAIALRELAREAPTPAGQAWLCRLAERFDAAAQPKMCEMDNCGEQAATTLHFPGLPKDVCLRHCREIEAKLHLLRGGSMDEARKIAGPTAKHW